MYKLIRVCQSRTNKIQSYVLYTKKMTVFSLVKYNLPIFYDLFMKKTFYYKTRVIKYVKLLPRVETITIRSGKKKP